MDTQSPDLNEKKAELSDQSAQNQPSAGPAPEAPGSPEETFPEAESFPEPSQEAQSSPESTPDRPYTEAFEPPSIGFATFILKIGAGFTAGVAANLILFILFLLTSSILKPILQPDIMETEINPLFVFAIIAIIFLTSLCGNMIGPLLFAFIQRDKYQKKATAMTHIFILNIIVLALLIPLYLVSTATTTTNLTSSIGALHLLMTTLSSLIIFEVVSNFRYALVGIYSTLLAILIGVGLNFILFEMTRGNWTILLFAAMPVIWTGIGFVSVIVEALYRWIYVTYGRDFLATSAEYGADYGVPEPSGPTAEEVEARKVQNEAGTEFLKHIN